MPFKTVRWLLIGLFAVLNLFLFQWWHAGQVAPTVTSNPGAALIKEIKRQHILLPDLRTEQLTGQYLAAVPEQFSAKKTASLTLKVDRSCTQLTGTFAKKTLLRSQQDFVANLQDGSLTLARNFSGSRWYNDWFTKDATQRYVAIQLYNNAPILSSKARLTVNMTGEKIKNFTLQRLTAFQKLDEERTLISQQDAVIDLYRYNELHAGDRVLQLQQGYDDVIKVNDHEIFVPVWLVWVQNEAGVNRLLLVNALTGENRTVH
ncbi:MAG TPA: two-component system regulatory protein YycI [Lactobacillaceae bacterium]|jgi:regulatory protein YycI of two-component signal transduction system YycFG